MLAYRIVSSFYFDEKNKEKYVIRKRGNKIHAHTSLVFIIFI